MGLQVVPGNVIPVSVMGVLADLIYLFFFLLLIELYFGTCIILSEVIFTPFPMFIAELVVVDFFYCLLFIALFVSLSPLL